MRRRLATLRAPLVPAEGEGVPRRPGLSKLLAAHATQPGTGEEQEKTHIAICLLFCLKSSGYASMCSFGVLFVLSHRNGGLNCRQLRLSLYT